MSQLPEKEKFHTLDPLGEIKNRAKSLWIEDGRPEGKSWSDYMGQAEEQLLSGISGGVASQRTPLPKEVTVCSPEIQAFREQTEDPLLAMLAWSFLHLLNAHEAFCLFHILRDHEIRLPEQKGKTALTPEQIAKQLAHLTNEYDESFWERHKGVELKSIPIHERMEYWRQKFKEWEARDEPLTYSDRNTIARLTEAVVKIA